MSNRYNKILCFFILNICVIPISVYAGDLDPMTAGGQFFSGILFGLLGTIICSIVVGVSFILAKLGKVSWDKCLSVGFCVAGFIGAPSIVLLIKSAISS